MLRKMQMAVFALEPRSCSGRRFVSVVVRPDFLCGVGWLRVTRFGSMVLLVVGVVQGHGCDGSG